MRFIHAADIHLDSPLHGLSRYADAPADRLRGATREAFTALITLAIEEKVDFLVIAGDLYDGDWPDTRTGLYFCGEMGRLKRAGIPAYVLFGNHDAENQMTKKLPLPDNVICFDARKAAVHRIDELKVALHGRSFKDRDTFENLVTHYPEPVPGYFNIGVLHTALEGESEHAKYAPCTRAELHDKGYDYWALGHVHEHAMWEGKSTIVFPGNLQGRNIRETGRRGAVMVEVDTGGRAAVERLFIDVLRWESVDVDASQCANMDAVSRQIGHQLERVLQVDGHVPRAVRVTISGESAAHGEMFALEGLFRTHVLAAIAAIGHDRLWLEKVKLATRPPATTVDDESRADALAELEELLAEAATDETLAKELLGDIELLATKAPELVKVVGALERARAGDVSQLLREVGPGLLARLAKSE